MREENRVRTVERDRFGGIFDRVSWGAIFAGAVLALIIQLMLSMLGIGIGAATMDPRTDPNPLSGMGFLGAVWLAIAGIVAMYIGGWTAGRMSGAVRRQAGMIHGAVMWGFTTLVALYFVTSAAGGLLSGTAGLLNGIVSAGSQIAMQSPEISDQIREELRQRGIDVDSIEAQAQDPQTQQQAQERARAAADTLASSLATAGLLTFGMMALGLIAALFGGASGVLPYLRTETGPVERAA